MILAAKEIQHGFPMQSQFYYTKFPITIIPEITIDVKYKLTGHMNSLVRTEVQRLVSYGGAYYLTPQMY